MVPTEIDELTGIDYPCHPEEKMSSSQYHFGYIMLLVDNLQLLFRDRAHEVGVFGDIQWYPVKDNRYITASPDVMVCFGVAQDRGRNRNSYVQHLENNVGPSVVFEIDSDSNTANEIEKKRAFYEAYGVQEYYWIFSEIPEPEVRVFIRNEGKLVEQTGFTEWTSPILGIRMDWTGTVLSIYNPDGSLMLHTLEYTIIERQRAQQEAQRAQQEAQARIAAEQQTEEQRIRAEQEAQRAQQEAQRAQRLLAFLREQGIEPPAE